MRAFFSKITGSISQNEGGGSVFGSRNDSSTDKQNRIYANIERSGTLLANAIDNIVNNKGGLSGDNSIGFERLLQILGTSNNEDVDTFQDNGIDCINYLHQHQSSDRFVEICNRTNLAESLIHSYRLMRVFEFKLSSRSSSTVNRARNNSSIGSDSDPNTPSDQLPSPMSGGRANSPSLVAIMTPPASGFASDVSSLAISATDTSMRSASLSPSPNSLTDSNRSSFREGALRPGVTKTAAEKVFIVLHILLSNNQTKEKLRESLPKFFIYPLLLFTADSIHLQHLAGKLVITACGSGLTGSQIGFLRDTGQLMQRMVDELKSLINFEVLKTSPPPIFLESPSGNSTPTSLFSLPTSPADNMLKGLAAEKAGMWLTSIEVIVKVISSSFCIGPLLLDDLKSCGGFLVIAKLLEFSSNENLSKELKMLTQIFYDHARGVENSTCYLQSGEIFNELLLSILGLKRRISVDDNFDKLAAVSKYLYDRKSKVVYREMIIKSLASALLTLYSADIKTCSVLEDTYCFTPLLLLTLPAIESPEAIVAVITTFQFVCQNTKEESSHIHLTTFSAVFTTIVNYCLKRSEPDPEKIFSLSYQIDVCFKSFDGVVKHNTKYALQFMKSGLLSNLICNQFRDLCEFLSIPSNRMSSDTGNILKRLISLLINSSYQSSMVADVIKNSELISSLKKIIQSDNVDKDFVNSCIQLPKSLGLAQPEENAFFLVSLCEEFEISDYRVAKCLQALQFILLSISHDAACSVWTKMEGKRFIKSSLSKMGAKFCTDPISDENYFLCLKDLLKLVTIDMNLFYPQQKSDVFYQDRCREYSVFIKEVTTLLFSSRVFNSNVLTKRCIDELLDLSVGVCYNEAPDKTLLYADFLQVAMIVNLNLKEEEQIYTVEKMLGLAKNVLFAAQSFCERGINRLLIANFYDKIRDPSSPVGKAIWTLIDYCMCKYLMVEDFTAVMYFLVRPSLLKLPNSYVNTTSLDPDKSVSLSGPDLGEIDQKLLPSWLAVCDGNQKNKINFNNNDDDDEANSNHSSSSSSSSSGGGSGDGNRIRTHSNSSNISSSKYWKFLESLSTNKDGLSSVPATPLGVILGRNYSNPAYISCQLHSPLDSQNSKEFLFPTLVFTASVWFRIPDVTSQLDGRTVLFSLGSVTNDEKNKNVYEGFFQIEYSRRSNSFYILLKKGDGKIDMKFKGVVDSTTWTNIVVTYKKARKVGFTTHKANLHVFINGIPATPASPETIDIDIPSTKQEIEIRFGDGMIEMELDAGIGPESLIKYWEMGPFLLFEEALTPGQVAALFLRGPVYTGNMQSRSPLSESLYSMSSYFLRNISHGYSILDSRVRESNSSLLTSYEVLAETAGVKGFESLIEPQVDSLKDYNVNRFKGFESLPPCILAFNASNLFSISINQKVRDRALEDKDNIFDISYNVRVPKVYLTNTKSFDSIGPAAELINSDAVFARQSLSSCVHTLGGPALFLPLLQHAMTSDDIVTFLSLIKRSINDNVTNLEFMHKTGLNLIAFLLSLKPKALITLAVLDELFKLSVNQYKMGDHTNILLVDSSAFYHLILNHQIWDNRRFKFVLKIVEMMLRLCQDSRFGHLNTKKLSALGVCKWILLICVHGAKQAAIVGSNTYDKAEHGRSNDWVFVSIPNGDTVDNEDQQDVFLRSSTRLVNLLISFDVKKEDLDLVSSLILYSFQESSLSQYESESIGSVFSVDRGLLSSPQIPASFRSDNPDTPYWNSNGSSNNATSSGNGTTVSESTNESGSSDADGTSPLPNTSDSKGSKVSAPNLLQVYLLQMLYFIYDEQNSVKERRADDSFLTLFRKSFHMDWFLTILQAYSDTSTRGYCMRLLGIMIQKDEIVRKDLYLKNHYRAIDAILSRQPEGLAVVLPILGLLCGIPMNLLPFPNQMRGGYQKILQLLDSVEEVEGPNCSDPVLEEFTLPLLSLLLNCISKITYANNISQNAFSTEDDDEDSETNSSSVVIDIIVGTLSAAIALPPSNISSSSTDKTKGDSDITSIRNNSFRELFQYRRAIELLTQTLIACSNAVDDIESAPHVIDLSSSVLDNYIFEDGSFEGDATRYVDDPAASSEDSEGSKKGKRVVDSSSSSSGPPHAFSLSRNQSSFKVAADSSEKTQHLARVDRIQKEGIKLSSDGVKILEIISQIVRNSIVEYNNPVALSQFLLAYPENLMDIFVSDFQILVFESVVPVFDALILHNNNFHKVLSNIINMFSIIISVAKVRLINIRVLSCIWKRVLSMIEKMKAHAEMSEESERRYQWVITDLTLTAKAYCTIIVQTLNIDKPFDIFKSNILHTIRYNMAELGSSVIVESESNTFFKGLNRMTKNISLDSSAAFVDTFVATWSTLDGFVMSNYTPNDHANRTLSKKPTSDGLLALSLVERQKFCQGFIAALISACLSYSLDECEDISNESLKILCVLLIRHRDQVDQLYSEKNFLHKSIKFNDADKEAFEGMLRLLPASTNEAAYNNDLGGSASNNFGEENRFREFKVWQRDNSAKWGVMESFDPYLKSLVATASPERQIKMQAKRDVSGVDHSMSTALANSEHKRTVNSKINDVLVHSLVHKWTIFGVYDLAKAMLAWKHEWESLQSGVVWGYLPFGKSQALVVAPNGKQESKLTFSLKSVSDSLHSKSSDFISNSENFAIFPQYKGWKLDSAVGVENMNRKIEQFYLHPRQAAPSTYLLIEGGSETSSPASSKSVSSKAPSANRPTVASMSFSRSPSRFDNNNGDVLVGGGVGLSNSSGNDTLVSSLDGRSSPKLSSTPFLLSPVTSPIKSSESMENMEDFLKKMTQQGVLKRTSAALKKSVDSNVEDVADGYPTSVSHEGSAQNAVELMQSIREDKEDSERIGVSTSGKVDAAEVIPKRSGKDNGHPGSDDLKPSEKIKRLERDDLSISNPSEKRQSAMPPDTPFVKQSRNPVLEAKDSRFVTKSAIILEILRGLIGPRELADTFLLNVNRIFGLEVIPAILIISSSKIHLIEGFAVKDKDVKKSPEEKVFEWLGDSDQDPGRFDKSFDEWTKSLLCSLLSSNTSITSINFEDVYSTFKRRYQLKYSALEVSTIYGASIMFACANPDENDNVLKRFFEVKMPNNIFHKIIDSLAFTNLNRMRGTKNLYNRVISIFLKNQTKLWQAGEISNFEYLTHLNSIAGRSLQDLTQYPVFPWVIADYDSPVLDLASSKTYRDLSKPMGASPNPDSTSAGEKRKKQFLDRYRTMDEFCSEGIDDSQVPFHYGTHYSCAGYVLNYLIRLEPYAAMAASLQGGAFDKADRLFSSIKSSWLSASQENLQDVRELTPEFFYLKEFLNNSNNYDFGITQKGEVVNDVGLPVWANNDPRTFVRLNREALECKYVSENLHHWIDLIFGYKQRGQEAVDAMNVFIHVTYDGEIDVDAIEDEVLRIATISQINNFGQTPALLFEKPHPKRVVPDILQKVKNWTEASESWSVDTSAINWHSHISAPFCVVGAEYRHTLLKSSFKDVQYIGSSVDSSLSSISDIKLLSKDKVLTLPARCLFLPNNLKYYLRFNGVTGSLGVAPIGNINSSNRSDADLTINVVFEDIHRQRITAAAASTVGDLIVTGSVDSTLRVWKLLNSSSNDPSLTLLHTLIGHTSDISCIDISSEWKIIASGSSDQSVMCWDSLTGRLRFVLPNHKGTILAISINAYDGNIVCTTSSNLYIYDVNGCLISHAHYPRYTDFQSEPIDIRPATTCISTNGPDWKNGVVAITGHEGGSYILWKTASEDQDTPRMSMAESYGINRGIKSDVEDLDFLVISGNHKDKDKDQDFTPATSGAAATTNAATTDIDQTKVSSTTHKRRKNVNRRQDLCIANMPPKMDGDICVLKLGVSVSSNAVNIAGASSAVDMATKNIISTGSDFEKPPDLIVCDVTGALEKHTLLRLDELTNSELQDYLNTRG